MILSLFFAQAIAASPPVDLTDLDQDGVIAEDLCPNIPADTPDGCPDFPVRNSTEPRTGIVKVLTSPTFPQALILHEKTHIRLGDYFRAVIWKALTKEVLSQSKILKVRE